MSPWDAQFLFVKKKDGVLRMCIGHRELNKITIKNKYPLPRIDDLFDRLQDERSFSKIYSRLGYHQRKIIPEDIPKPAIRIRFGHCEFTVIPIGLTNAPVTFYGFMNRVFKPYLGKFMLVFIGNILIHSKDRDECITHLRTVLRTLREQKSHSKYKKLEF